MRTTVLPVVLPAKLYAELERQARAQERHPVRQAQWLLKQALAGEGVGALSVDNQLTAAGGVAPPGEAP
jgi:hypothetical protein